jgi:hypothetical protein
MNLLNKIALHYFKNTAIVFLFALGILYFAIDEIIISEVNEQLRKTNREVREKLENGIVVNYHPFVEIAEVKKIPENYSRYDDVEIEYDEKNEVETFRQYVAYATINGKHYIVVTRSSLIEEEDLFGAILILMSSILVALLIILFLVNRKATRKIFNPFYENLKKLDSFSLQKNSELALESSGIFEFEELNYSLMILSRKAKKEYDLLKEFTEDLSHELQTPVSVIKSKLELILQKEINEADIENYFQTIYQNINKLDKLNRTLLLLTKLESPDFFQSKKINVKDSIKKSIEIFCDAAAAENINIELNLYSDKSIEMNDVLFETLLNNLFSNAVKHNNRNGEIIIEFNENKLIIKNTGEKPNVNPEMFFNRFVRDKKIKDSTGLGLSVVKKICDLYDFKISYNYITPYHVIEVAF